MAITVKEVAVHAGVSTATVSRVLNNDPGIKPSTREKVLKAIKDTGYRMNRAARSLKTSRTGTVGLLVPELVNDFFMTVAKGVEDELRAYGYGVILCNANENTDDEKDRIELLIEQCVDGVIIIPVGSKGNHFNLLSRTETPVVLVDRLVEDFSSDAVLADNISGAFSAVEKLIADGCRRFGFIGGSLDLSNFRERYEGFQKALDAHGIKPEPEIIKFGDVHIESGYRFMKELMEAPSPPENVFIANYFLHVGAAKFLFEHKNELPCDIRIAGFDDMALSSILGFSSVTVSQPMLEMGKTAANLLMRRIKKETEECCSIIRLETSLIEH